ncbi:MAG: ShlB/FhaC/HecB family hemolysin secretion/activation protein [Gammaproteobacteria bacterium]
MRNGSAFPARALALAVSATSLWLLGAAPAVVAASPTQPESALPGAIRPGSPVPGKTPAAGSAGAAAALGEAFKLGFRSLAQVADLPDAARPGAIRPGEDRKLIPRAPPEETEFAVPPVVDRPLDIDDGDKVVVTRFVLDGARDRPEHAIEVAEIESLLAQKLAARPAGFTVGRLQEVADEVTRYYRERGLILAQAFVPVQTVEAGEVRVQVMEGLLGRVVIEGNELYRTEILELPFRSLVGQPVTKDSIESALLRASDYPGQSSFGVFQPGIEVGTADMVVNVQDEQRFEFAVRADNHGITETGQNRYLGRVAWNNPLGQGDRLATTVQHTAVPDNTFFYAVDYEVPVATLYDSTFSIGTSRNQFDVGGQFRNANIYSDVRNYHLAVHNDLIRSRLMNLNLGLRMTKKQSETKASGRAVSLDNLAVLSFELNFDNVDARFGGLNAAYLEVSHGFNDALGAMGRQVASVQPSRQGGNGRFATGEFDKILLSASRFQALTPLWDKLDDHNLLLTFEAFWSPDLLVPLEQYNVGGPTNVRGYRPTEALFDRALFGSFEWIINAPFIADQAAFGNRTWGELLQLSFFYDIATGKLNSALPTEKASENFQSVGFALSFNNPKVFSGRITIATPIGDPDPQNGKEPQYWVDLNFFF